MEPDNKNKPDDEKSDISNDEQCKADDRTNWWKDFWNDLIPPDHFLNSDFAGWCLILGGCYFMGFIANGCSCYPFMY